MMDLRLSHLAHRATSAAHRYLGKTAGGTPLVLRSVEEMPSLPFCGMNARMNVVWEQIYFGVQGLAGHDYRITAAPASLLQREFPQRSPLIW